MDKDVFQLAADLKPALTDKWYRPIMQALECFGIEQEQYIAAWIAQFGHECAGFTALVENMNYSTDGLVATWPSRFTKMVGTSKALAQDYARQPEKIGNFVYANRMGNGDISTGNGYKYRGRGLPMVTGKSYYQSCSDGIGVDLITEPELLEQSKYAALAGAWVWADKSCDQYVDKNDFKGLTRAINGGLIGLEDRLARWLKAKKALGIQ